MKATTSILGLTALHFVASRLLFLSSFGAGMSLDIGEPLSKGQALVTHVSGLLDLPLSLTFGAIPVGWFSGLWGYIPFFLNSLVWGTAIYFVIRFYKRQRLVRQAGR